MIRFHVKIKNPVKKFDDAFGSFQVLRAFNTWAVMYRAAMQERFAVLSRGGGEWPPLAEATIMARRHGKGGKFKRGRAAYAKAKATGGGQVAILRDTGTLFTALSPVFGTPGQLQSILKNGVKIGFSEDNHPKGGSIAAIASAHQTGSTKLPKRAILVSPSIALESQMSDVLNIALIDALGLK